MPFSLSDRELDQILTAFKHRVNVGGRRPDSTAQPAQCTAVGMIPFEGQEEGKPFVECAGFRSAELEDLPWQITTLGDE